MNGKLAIDKDSIADFCRRHHITRLAIFGSALVKIPGRTSIRMCW